MDKLSVADVLDRAADRVAPKGAWLQGHYVGPNGDCWCVLGAIRHEGLYRDDTNPAVLALQEFLGVTWVHEWNDDPETTQAEVVAKLREAAKLAREQSPC